MSVEFYGKTWPDGTHKLQACLYMMRTLKTADELFPYFMEARKMAWPDRYRHKWTDLIYQEILKNRFTVLMGAASTQKSSHAAEFILLDYWCSSHNTCSLVSSTTRDKLESGAWGELKMLFLKAFERFDFLPGHVIDSRMAIVTDDIDDGDVRDFRKGIICKACYVGKSSVGLGAYAGIKQERFRFLCEELQFMQPTFLDCIPNMSSNTGSGGLKIIGSANPDHNPDSQLGLAAEPANIGWSGVEEVEKTTVWETNFFGGRCVNLIGTDSANFDAPEGKEPFKGLIGREFAKIIEHDYGKDSPEYERQVMGRMRMSLAHSRVITREVCRIHRAHDKVTWLGGPLVKVKAVDPAYGAGDRCTCVSLEFGLNIDKKNVIRVVSHKVIKINLKDSRTPEAQIAEYVKTDCDSDGTPYSNVGYDSFGKGTCGYAFAIVFGSFCPQPVDSGGTTTDRPVRLDLKIWDDKIKSMRLKKCSEEYSKFVTEMWFSVRYAIEAEQLFELPVEIMLEGCAREYELVSGNKIEVEPKALMRSRLGKSPDFFDGLAIGVEMCRRRGFKISKLGEELEAFRDLSWFTKHFDRAKSLAKKNSLSFR